RRVHTGQDGASLLGKWRPDQGLDRLAQPSGKRHLRRPSEHPPDLLDVHGTTADVVDVPSVHVLDLGVHAELAGDRLRQREHRGLDAGADVEYLTLSPRM